MDTATDGSPSASRPDGQQSPAWTAGRLLRIVILIFSLVCFGWVLRPILQHAGELAEKLHGPAVVLRMLEGLGLFVIVNFAMAMAWRWLSGVYGRRPSVIGGFAIWSRSNIAKYLPSNTLHYVQRQVMGRSFGLGHAALAGSTLLEVASQTFAGVLIGLAINLAIRTEMPLTFSWPWLAVLGAALLAAWPLADWLLRRVRWTAKRMEQLPRLSLTGTLRLLGGSVALHLAFFVGTGLALYRLLSVVGGSKPGILETIWFFTLAWAGGMFTIGAPAGVGVREAILTLQLAPLVGEADAAIVAVALRLVTTLGDAVSAALGWSVRPAAEADAPPSFEDQR